MERQRNKPQTKGKEEASARMLNEIEIINKSQEEMKNTISELKNKVVFYPFI